MKAEIHPKYNTKAKVTCACGESFLVGSTKDEIDVEICSNCHPFYTGQEKIVDTAGRVEKFKTRISKADTKKIAEKKAKKAEKKAKVGTKKEEKAKKASKK